MRPLLYRFWALDKVLHWTGKVCDAANIVHA
jgi:hypothetical protein